MKNLFTSRRFRQGSAATAITVLALALIVVLNMVVVSLGNRFGLSLDLSENKLFSISDDTREYIATVQKNVTIYVLNEEEAFTNKGDLYLQAAEILRNYSRMSDYIDVQYVDIVKDPGFAAQYAHLQPTADLILVVSGDNAATVSPSAFVNTKQNYDGTTTYSSQAEQALTAAILNVTSDKRLHITFLQGHDEDELESFRALLEKNNYLITTQNLLTEDVNPDADIAVLAAPKRDLTEDEMRRLDRYLANDGQKGKTLFYLTSADQPDLPGLNAFLADWGIGVESGVVFDADYTRLLMVNGMPSYYIAVVDYAEAEYSAGMQARQLMAGSSFAKPLSVLFDAQGSRTPETLLQFSQTSGIRPADAEENWEIGVENISGPIPTLVLSTDLSYDNMNPLRSYVLAGGSVQALDATFLNTASLANSEYYLGLLNTLAGKEASVVIQDKTLGSDTLGITYQHYWLFNLLLVVVLPLAVLVTGMVIWMRRRHK